MTTTGEDTKWKQKTGDKKRVQCAATFEVMPKFFGFNDSVILRSVRVDSSRNIVYFYFGGEGLEEVEREFCVDLTCSEGQECREIIPPAWQEHAKGQQ